MALEAVRGSKGLSDSTRCYKRGLRGYQYVWYRRIQEASLILQGWYKTLQEVSEVLSGWY